MNDRHRIGSVIYWVISVITIVALFFLAFGVICPYFVDKRLDHLAAIAACISGIGLLILILSVHQPRMLWGAVVSKPGAGANCCPDIIGARILGLSLVAGGLLYAHYAHAAAIVLSFGAGVLLIQLRISYLKRRYWRGKGSEL